MNITEKLRAHIVAAEVDADHLLIGEHWTLARTRRQDVYWLRSYLASIEQADLVAPRRPALSALAGK